MSNASYPINPNRELPWNDLPMLPLPEACYRKLEIIEALVSAKEALARLQGRSVVIPNQGMLINTISLQEAKASSAIENIFTTDDELYKAFSDQVSEAIGSAKEVLRYREALWSGYHHLLERGQFSLEYFIKVFREVKQTAEGIRPDFLPTVIKQGGSGMQAGTVVYTPPRGNGVLELKMENLIAFMNDDASFPIDPLLKMIITHYQFEAIHPFRDGNGRTGRIANIHFLTSKGLLDLPILYLSRYILEHKDEYYSGLRSISQKGKWDPWFLFMLKAVEVTSNITYGKINDIMSIQELILSVVRKDAKSIRKPEKLVEMLFTQPYTKVHHLVKAGIYAENTARNYLHTLADMQIVEKREIGGGHYFLNLELHRILAG
jgi:Fic family protein